MDVGVGVSALRRSSSVAFFAISPMSQPYVRIYLTARPREEAVFSSSPPLALFKARLKAGHFAFEIDRAPVDLPALTFAFAFLLSELFFEDLDPLEKVPIHG